MKKAWSFLKNIKGFTLIELIMIVIIVGVLASLALTQYAAFKEKAIVAEAVTAIGTIKTGIVAFGLDYTGMTFPTYPNEDSIAQGLGVAVNSTNWSYSVRIVQEKYTGILRYDIYAVRKAANGGDAYLNKVIILRYYIAAHTIMWSADSTHPYRPQNADGS